MSQTLKPGVSFTRPQRQGYRRKLKCSVCDCVFPSYKAFSKHYLFKHRKIPFIKTQDGFDFPDKYKIPGGSGYWETPGEVLQDFNFIVVDGGYIDSRTEDCRKNVIKFSPGGPLYREIQGDLPQEEIDHLHKEMPCNCGMRVCVKCKNARFLKIFRKYFPFVQGFYQPKLLTLENKTHHELSHPFKKDFESQFRNFWRNLMKALKDDPESFIDKTWARTRRSRKPKEYANVLATYQAYADCSKYLLGMEIKETKNGRYWHFHAIVDLPYIDSKKLSSFWFKQTGSSVNIKAIGDLPENDRKRFESSMLWDILQKRYPSADSNMLRSLWYCVKYIVKMDWLTSDEYSWFGYAKNFVQKSHEKQDLLEALEDDIIKLGSLGTISTFLTPQVTTLDGQTYTIRLYFDGVYPHEVEKPPPDHADWDDKLVFHLAESPGSHMTTPEISRKFGVQDHQKIFNTLRNRPDIIDFGIERWRLRTWETTKKSDTVPIAEVR